MTTKFIPVTIGDRPIARIKIDDKGKITGDVFQSFIEVLQEVGAGQPLEVSVLVKPGMPSSDAMAKIQQYIQAVDPL